MYRSFKPRKLSEDVVEHLTDLFVRQELRPGDKLPPERLLAEEFGVSRTVVREAVKMLEEKGLLDSKQGSGTYVRGITSASISASVSLYVQSDVNRYIELMDLRSIIDVEIAGRLARKATPEQITALTQHLDRMGQLLDKPEEFAAEDVAFHLDFYRATDNSVLVSIVQPILVLLESAMRMTIDEPGSAQRSLSRHIDLIECIKRHDADAARRTMHEIITRGEGRVLEHIHRQQAALDLANAN